MLTCRHTWHTDSLISLRLSLWKCKTPWQTDIDTGFRFPERRRGEHVTHRHTSRPEVTCAPARSARCTSTSTASPPRVDIPQIPIFVARRHCPPTRLGCRTVTGCSHIPEPSVISGARGVGGLICIHQIQLQKLDRQQSTSLLGSSLSSGASLLVRLAYRHRLTVVDVPHHGVHHERC